jgi:hypothetical protein
MELRVNVDDAFIKQLQDNLDAKTPEIAKSALTLLNWAVSEAKQGRVILSSDQAGQNVQRLAMPALQAVQKSET